MAGARPLPAIAFTASALMVGQTILQLLNGLETGLAMGAITWALVAAATPGKHAGRSLAALCGLLPFLRPELVALSVLLLAIPALRRARADLPAAARQLAEGILIAIASAAPWLLLTFWNTDDIVPVTVGAKQAWFAERDWTADGKLHWIRIHFLAFLGSFGAFTVLAVALLWRSAVGVAGLVFACVLVAAFWIDLPSGFSHYRQRYLYVLAPLLVFAAAAVFRTVPASRHGFIAALLLAQGGFFAVPAVRNLEEDTAWSRRELSAVANWTRANLPRDSVLLIHDAGYIAWATPFRMVDLVGLKTPSSIALHRQMTLPSGGVHRPEAMSLIATRAQPSHLVVLDQWESVFKIREGLISQGWSAEPMKTDGFYKVYRLKPPL